MAAASAAAFPTSTATEAFGCQSARYPTPVPTTGTPAIAASSATIGPDSCTELTTSKSARSTCERSSACVIGGLKRRTASRPRDCAVCLIRGDNAPSPTTSSSKHNPDARTIAIASSKVAWSLTSVKRPTWSKRSAAPSRRGLGGRGGHCRKSTPRITVLAAIPTRAARSRM